MDASDISEGDLTLETPASILCLLRSIPQSAFPVNEDPPSILYELILPSTVEVRCAGGEKNHA
jgi:hypothetical protein